jgi:hypothetical protein
MFLDIAIEAWIGIALIVAFIVWDIVKIKRKDR